MTGMLLILVPAAGAASEGNKGFSIGTVCGLKAVVK